MIYHSTYQDYYHNVGVPVEVVTDNKAHDNNRYNLITGAIKKQGIAHRYIYISLSVIIDHFRLHLLSSLVPPSMVMRHYISYELEFMVMASLCAEIFQLNCPSTQAVPPTSNCVLPFQQIAGSWR